MRIRQPLKKTVNILGIRGIPARHGGFETFAEKLALFLVREGWSVNVYCQEEGSSSTKLYEDDWNGVRRIHVTVPDSSSLNTVRFDFKCVKDVLERPGVDLVLGYNTAIINLLQRLRGRKVLMNMDGVEWKRAKWSIPIKAWFYLNEFIGSHLATTAIADHPEIAMHLRRHGLRKCAVIPYGSDSVTDAPQSPLEKLGLTKDNYFISIARIEPENSIKEMVKAFSARKRKAKFVVLGNFSADNSYHNDVKSSASEEVIFPGAIYDAAIVRSLRFHARCYLHGHQVGGTNPSLVEALGAGNAIIAHSNKFNIWVAGNDQFYFKDADDLDRLFNELLQDDNRVNKARIYSTLLHKRMFEWENILSEYASLLEKSILEAGYAK